MRSSILCICAVLVLGPGGRVVWSQSKAQLRRLVLDYRTRIRAIDLSYTYQWERLADEPGRPSDGRIFKEIVHLKRQGQKYFYESTSWKDPNTKVPIHHLHAYDGEKSIFYDFAAGRGSIVTGYDEQAEPVSAFYNALKWPTRRPVRPSPFSDLVVLLGSDDAVILPDRETVHGVETVVVECNPQKIWLDVRHGGILRRCVSGLPPDPPRERYDISEVRDVNGLYIPTKIVRTRFADRRDTAEPGEVAVSRYTITVPKDGLRINSGLTKEDFGFRFPPGTRVLDVTAGRSYTVDRAADRE
jgi:hypothetical protein